jgi:hypothetical protein
MTSMSARLAVLATLFAAPGCGREADLYDEPDGFGGTTTPPRLEAGATPIVDSGLGTDAFPPCSQRPVGGCQGPVDFPCAFTTWVDVTAIKCQKLTSCSANGWLRVYLGVEGCIDAIGMDQPSAAIARCLEAEFGPYRCPCRTSEATHFFGLANSPDGGVCTGPKGLQIEGTAAHEASR